VKRAARIAAAALVVAVPLVLFTAAPAAAAGCDPVELRTDATVNPDASMDVVEHFTYDFSGTCHGGIRQINLSSSEADDGLGTTQYTLSPITVTENGEPVPLAEQRPGFVKWGQANVLVSGAHEYDLSYRVNNAVDVSPDVAVLNWRFVGTDFPFQRDVDVTIHTPGDGTGLKIFVHGALNGDSKIVGSTIHITVPDNPAGTKVEARMLEPSSDFTIPPSGDSLEQRILQREAALADQANARRQELKDDINRKKTLKTIGNIAGPIVALVGIGAFVVIFLEWGKEPKHPDDIGEYWREIPDDTPAVCQTLVGFGSVPNDAFTSTLIDLAQRGWLTITEQHTSGFLGRDETDYVFTRTPKADGPLTEYENKVLWRLFPNGGSVTQEDLVEQARSDRQASAAWMQDFKGEVHADYATKGYVDTGHATKWLLHGLTILLLGGAALLLGLAFEAPLGWLPAAVAVVLVLCSPLLRKRTVKGARAIAEVEGLRHFLKDFSRLPDESHAGDLILYERYLVYAVALGVARELVEGLRVRFPDLAQPNAGFAVWYVAASMNGFAGGGLNGISNLGSFASEFTSATAAAFSPPSSSTGAGGGFSGGSSGGGGGGGAGGW
jgi:uncharacterized membrane protein